MPEETIQKRWKSKAAWVTALSQIVIVAALFFAPEVTDAIKIIGTAVIAVAAGFGAFNNPTNKTGF